MPDQQNLRLAVVDDHQQFRRGMINLVKLVCPGCEIIFEADDGIDLQEKINPDALPDLVLMDINMPRMDGFAAVQWLNEKYPGIKILILSMIEDQGTMQRMRNLNVAGYLFKDVEPLELKQALDKIREGNVHFTECRS